jgi:hypothetical protein
MSEVNRPEFLQQGEAARLIPVYAEASKEQRLTSSLLAVFMSVDEFGKSMLQMVKAPATKSSKIECFTEVVFKNSLNAQKCRPDGLITVKLGANTWTAIIEAKVGNAELTKEQIETYLDIARENKVNAVITISNQFAALPHHHPIQVSKRKIKSVSLYHWSWTSIVSKARLLAEHKGISDPDQAFILKELIRYLQHQSSGVLSFSRMCQYWKDLCTAVQQAAPLSKNDDLVIESISDWHQLVKYISLQMSLEAGRTVSVNISRVHSDDSSKRLNDDIDSFLKAHCLEAEYDIPNAATRLKLCADMSRRTLTASMRLKAPTDKSRATAIINWALRQVAKCDDDNLIIRSIWPGRMQDTTATLGQLRDDQKIILGPNLSVIPSYVEFSRVIDIAGRFRGSSTFVEDAKNVIPDFYRDIGQHLKAWIPPAPKLPPKKEFESEVPKITIITDDPKIIDQVTSTH